MSESQKPTSDSLLPPGTRVAVQEAVQEAIEEFESARSEREKPEREREDKKEHLTNHVSIAAISLTMLMSFLNFARTERDQAASAARTEAADAHARAETNWAHYQSKITERATYRIADDTVIHNTSTLPDEDPRVSAAHVQHIEYQSRLRAIDHENQQLFFLIQDLERSSTAAVRRADNIDRSVSRYDLGARVLTLALVLLSVTLLANRRFLFWVGLGVSAAGAAIAVNGYFLWW